LAALQYYFSIMMSKSNCRLAGVECVASALWLYAKWEVNLTVSPFPWPPYLRLGISSWQGMARLSWQLAFNSQFMTLHMK
jgi:hypothetical protein